MTRTSGRAATRGPVLIVGTGLIGTSIALGLRTLGVEVWLSDPSPTSQALAADMGGGTQLPDVGSGRQPALVVVAAPPDVLGRVVVDALVRYPRAIVTDVASVKDAIMEDVRTYHRVDAASGGNLDQELPRYVGSHPMAGRARSGASHADGDLFYGRPWVIVPTEWSADTAVLAVRNLVVDLGGVPTELDPADHDRAVALVSHVPQLVASLLAARLAEATPEALGLAGQGLRDTTRIAASDPGLWTAIIAGNSGPIVEVLRQFEADLQRLLERLGAPGTSGELPIAPGAAGAVSRVITSGNRGVERIPGKHGDTPRRWGSLEVLVPDKPGELGRLFTELGDADINIEDLTLEHSARQPVGLARVMLDPAKLDQAEEELVRRGWRVATKEVG